MQAYARPEYGIRSFWKSWFDPVNEELVNFFYEGLDSKYFQLYWKKGLYHNYSALSLVPKNRHMIQKGISISHFQTSGVNNHANVVPACLANVFQPQASSLWIQ